MKAILVPISPRPVSSAWERLFAAMLLRAVQDLCSADFRLAAEARAYLLENGLDLCEYLSLDTRCLYRLLDPKRLFKNLLGKPDGGGQFEA